MGKMWCGILRMKKCEEMHISMKELFELIPKKNLRYAAGGTELADLLWIINGT